MTNLYCHTKQDGKMVTTYSRYRLLRFTGQYPTPLRIFKQMVMLTSKIDKQLNIVEVDWWRGKYYLNLLPCLNCQPPFICTTHQNITENRREVT